MSVTVEASFDGLVGPTHNYAGLSHGNVASTTNQGLVARPRDAAREGLAKMRFVAGTLGIVQGVLPPHERPHVPTLRRLGFSGTEADVISSAAKHPPLLAQACSASAMWAANAATVLPSRDTEDGRLHFVPANLQTTFHRSIEPPVTTRILRRMFDDGSRFVVHEPLPAASQLGDEGAANHTRLIGEGRALHLFVFGRRAFSPGPEPKKFPARQTYEASLAVARLAGVREAVFVQQSPAAIDAGVFHNDVISVGHERVLFFHEDAFVETDRVIEMLDAKLGGALIAVRVRRDEVPVEDVVRSYLFNSQLVATHGHLALIAPRECEEHDGTRRVIERVIADAANPISAVHYLDVRQSMRNGGGPACLRLRVQLEPSERTALRQTTLFDARLDAALTAIVEHRYREELSESDLADPKLLDESRTALDEITQALDLGSIYDFQRSP